ncbi:nucleotidyltransferase family protein [Catenovulum sediminis]|uniref:nucleotidyltransferase family protein n=1 Tax=Catenovulum sediminis TaxID=1740262 RepID=UPI0011809361|nr:nucleotidyltransferase family protein [Catenovulum sediminis]
MVKDWHKTLVSEDSTILDAMKVIDKSTLQVALVISSQQKLVGVVTDGDIRRGLINNHLLSDPVVNIMNTKPLALDTSSSETQRIEFLLQHGIRHLPILKDGKLVDLFIYPSLRKKTYNNPVFLMAGGFGKRLRPLTENCPKPLLKIGSKPILELILLRFINAGFYNFFISTHYLPEKIVAHFGDGRKWGVQITYVHEETPLGTAGGLSLVKQQNIQAPMIVMNGDLLTKVDFTKLIDFHAKSQAIATMCIKHETYQIPYGVVEYNDNTLTGITEKPTKSYFINAGIYVLNPALVKSIDENTYLDMPTLLEMNLNKGQEVAVFPIHEYWLDIGQHEEYSQAQIDFHTDDYES